eukprot:4155493-Amphidinium_carterae.1
MAMNQLCSLACLQSLIFAVKIGTCLTSASAALSLLRADDNCSSTPQCKMPCTAPPTQRSTAAWSSTVLSSTSFSAFLPSVLKHQQQHKQPQQQHRPHSSIAITIIVIVIVI